MNQVCSIPSIVLCYYHVGWAKHLYFFSHGLHYVFAFGSIFSRLRLGATGHLVYGKYSMKHTSQGVPTN